MNPQTLKDDQELKEQASRLKPSEALAPGKTHTGPDFSEDRVESHLNLQTGIANSKAPLVKTAIE